MSIQKFNPIMRFLEGIETRLDYLGYATVDTGWKTDQLATPFNRLYIIEQGTGSLFAGNETHPLLPGKAYLLPAGLPCSYHCDGSLSLLFFHFNLLQADQLDLMQGTDRIAVTDCSPDAFSRLRAACGSTGYTAAFEILCAVNSILLEMNRNYDFRWDRLPSYSACVASTIHEIKRNLSAQLRIDALAQRQFISRGYLARQFKTEVGMTIKQYIRMQLIDAAQLQLSHTDASVEQISNELGFCNQFYFSECFKKHCRVSPLQYRKGTKY